MENSGIKRVKRGKYSRQLAAVAFTKHNLYRQSKKTSGQLCRVMLMSRRMPQLPITCPWKFHSALTVGYNTSRRAHSRRDCRVGLTRVRGTTNRFSQAACILQEALMRLCQGKGTAVRLPFPMHSAFVDLTLCYEWRRFSLHRILGRVENDLSKIQGASRSQGAASHVSETKKAQAIVA